MFMMMYPGMLLHGIDRLKKITIGSSYVTDLRYTNYVHYRTYTTVVPVQYISTTTFLLLYRTRLLNLKLK